MLVDIEFRVEKERATRLSRHIGESLQVLELVFSCRENEKVDRDLDMGKLIACIEEVLI